MGNSCRCKRNSFPTSVPCKEYHDCENKDFTKGSLNKGMSVSHSTDTTHCKKLLFRKSIHSLARTVWNFKKHSRPKNGILPQHILSTINLQQNTPSTNNSRNNGCSWEAPSNILKDAKQIGGPIFDSHAAEKGCLETLPSTKQITLEEKKNDFHIFVNELFDENHFKKSEKKGAVSPKNTFEYHRQAVLQSPDSKMSHETKVSTTASTHSLDSLLNPCKDELNFFHNAKSSLSNNHVYLTTRQVTLNESETNPLGYSPCQLKMRPYRIVNPAPFSYFQGITTTQLKSTRLACKKKQTKAVRSKDGTFKRISHRRHDKRHCFNRLMYQQAFRHLQPKKGYRNQGLLCTRLMHKKANCRELSLVFSRAQKPKQSISVKHKEIHPTQEDPPENMLVTNDSNERQTIPHGCNKIDHLVATTNEFQKFFCCSSSSSKNFCPSLFVESQETPLFPSPCYPENWNKEISSTPQPKIKVELQLKKILNLKGITTKSFTKERSHTDRPMLRGSMQYHHPLATSRLCF